MSTLVRISDAERVIFVGDTHGDFYTSKKIIKNYMNKGTKIIFLGDYVDRGLYSRKNLEFLLHQRKKYPDRIILLQGNHEGYMIYNFSPAEFWESLEEKEKLKFYKTLKKLPLIAIVKDIIAVHAGLPMIKKIEEIKNIKIGSKNWYFVCWGDFLEEKGAYLGIDPLTGRPLFGRDYFFSIMKKLKKKVLIRSHQPDAKTFMFDNRCLTIFTSSFYGRRQIVIYDLEKKIKDATDLEIIEI